MTARPLRGLPKIRSWTRVIGKPAKREIGGTEIVNNGILEDANVIPVKLYRRRATERVLSHSTAVRHLARTGKVGKMDNGFAVQFRYAR